MFCHVCGGLHFKALQSNTKFTMILQTPSHANLTISDKLLKPSRGGALYYSRRARFAMRKSRFCVLLRQQTTKRKGKRLSVMDLMHLQAFCIWQLCILRWVQYRNFERVTNIFQLLNLTRQMSADLMILPPSLEYRVKAPSGTPVHPSLMALIST